MHHRRLIILTAPSQQIAVLNVATTFSGVPPRTYEWRFYPYSLSRIVFVLATIFVILWN